MNYIDEWKHTWMGQLEDPNVYYVLTDFGGNGPSTILETIDGNYARVEKNSGAETWAAVLILFLIKSVCEI